MALGSSFSGEPWYENAVARQRELAESDPEAYLAQLEKSGSVMLAPGLEVAAEYLRKAGMGGTTEPQTRRRRRRR